MSRGRAPSGSKLRGPDPQGTGRKKRGRERMRLKHLVMGMGVAGLTLATDAVAQSGTFIPLLTYRTGPFANSGTPIANGMHDYFAMLNERDGGIGGSRLVLEECETGYKNERGVECYEALKSKRP